MGLHNKLINISSRAQIVKIKPRDYGHYRQKGFTLIEILIVIVIISIISGIAMLTISHNQKKEYEYLAKSLSHLITLAEEEAMLRPATLGLAFTANSYQFFEYQDKVDNNKSHWHPLTDRLYGLHHFSNNINVAVQVQNKAVALDGQPKIIISASGDIIPFTIWIGKAGQTPSYQVKGYENGNVISGIFHEK